MKYQYKPLTEADLQLLHQWFQLPHVNRWYAQEKEWSVEQIRDYYLPRVENSLIPSFIIHHDSKAIGYIQYYLLHDHIPDHWQSDDCHSLSVRSEQCVGIDMFIGGEAYLGKGCSTHIIGQFIDTVVPADRQCIIVDPKAENNRAIAAFAKAGFEPFKQKNGTHLMVLKRI